MGGHSSKFKDITQTETVPLLTIDGITYKVVLSKGTYKDNDFFWVLHDSSVGTIMNMFLKIFNGDIQRIVPRFKQVMNILRDGYENIFATIGGYYNIKVTEKNIRGVGTNHIVSYGTALYSAKISNKSSYSLNISQYVGNYTIPQNNSGQFNVFVPDLNIDRDNKEIITVEDFSYNPHIDKVFHLKHLCKHKNRKSRFTTLDSLHDMVHVIYQELKLYYVHGQDITTTRDVINKIIKKHSKYERCGAIINIDLDLNNPVIIMYVRYKLQDSDVVVGFSMTGVEVKNGDPDMEDTLKVVILNVSSVPLNDSIKDANHLHHKNYTHFN